jgi:rubredoxin
MNPIEMKNYVCVVCGFVYAEAEGRPEDGIVPGTPWCDVPDDWACPDCGAAKAMLEMMEF